MVIPSQVRRTLETNDVALICITHRIIFPGSSYERKLFMIEDRTVACVINGEH